MMGIEGNNIIMDTTQPANPVPAAVSAQSGSSSWSWAGFMFDPIVIVGTRNYKMLFWYLLMLIPFVNIIFLIVFKVYMGMHARMVVSESKAFANKDEAAGFQKALDHAGLIFFYVAIAFFVVWVLLFGTVIFSTIFSGGMMMRGGDYGRQPIQYQVNQ